MKIKNKNNLVVVATQCRAAGELLCANSTPARNGKYHRREARAASMPQPPPLVWRDLGGSGKWGRRPLQPLPLHVVATAAALPPPAGTGREGGLAATTPSSLLVGAGSARGREGELPPRRHRRTPSSLPPLPPMLL